jgi:hypothetical protein
MLLQNQTAPLLLVLAVASAFAFYAFNRGLKRSKLDRRARLLILGTILVLVSAAIVVGELFPG